MFSSRLKKILAILLDLEDGQTMKIDDLAQKIQASRRTVFRELKDIDRQLKETGCQVISYPGRGIALEGTLKQKENLQAILQVSDVPYLDKKERQRLLAYALLEREEVSKFIVYANMFQVSEATISNDLDALEPWFAQHGMLIERKGKNRIFIRGQEERRREAMSAIVREQLLCAGQSSEALLEESDFLQELFPNTERNSIYRLLDQNLLAKITAMFKEYQHDLALDAYAQSAVIGLIIHLVVAAQRIQKHESVQIPAHLMQEAMSSSMYQKAEKIAEVMENELEISIPAEEISFIALHLMGAKLAWQPDQKESNAQLEKIVADMIMQYDRDTAFHLSQDEQYIQGLIAHLKPAVLRLQNQMPIYNPLLGQLKSQYPNLYAQSQKAAEVLEREFLTPVSAEEIGFLTMHAGASLERRIPVPVKRKAVVGIVCASGIGSSALLAARARKAFSSRAVFHTLSISDVENGRLKGCEFLISPFELRNAPLPSVKVSILLSQKDISKIEQQMETQKNSALEQQMEVLSQSYGRLQYMHQASLAALQIIEHFSCTEIPAGVSVRQMIHMAAGLLEGNFEQMEEDLLAREELGSILSQDYGFVMFHAATSGSQIPQFLLMYPDRKAFLDSALQQVQVGIVSVIPKPYTPVEQEMTAALSSALIEDEDFLQAIRNRDDAAAASKISEILNSCIMHTLRT